MTKSVLEACLQEGHIVSGLARSSSAEIICNSQMFIIYSILNRVTPGTGMQLAAGERN